VSILGLATARAIGNKIANMIYISIFCFGGFLNF